MTTPNSELEKEILAIFNSNPKADQAKTDKETVDWYVNKVLALIHTENQRAVEQHIKPYLDECEAQNGIRHCKNCGLEPINQSEEKL